MQRTGRSALKAASGALSAPAEGASAAANQSPHIDVLGSMKSSGLFFGVFANSPGRWKQYNFGIGLKGAGYGEANLSTRSNRRTCRNSSRLKTRRGSIRARPDRFIA